MRCTVPLPTPFSAAISDAFASGRQRRTDHAFLARCDRGAAKAPPVRFCSREAGVDALDDHRALKLGKDAHHLKHRFARRRGRIDPLLMQVQVDAFAVQLTEERDQSCREPQGDRPTRPRPNRTRAG